MSDTIEQRVARGATWLDEQTPGWRDAIDLGDLNLVSTCNCVLGQVYSEASTCGRAGYWYVMNELHPHIEAGQDFYHWPADHGFASFHGHHQFMGPGYRLYLEENAALNAEWRSVIHASRVPAEQREPSHV